MEKTGISPNRNSENVLKKNLKELETSFLKSFEIDGKEFELLPNGKYKAIINWVITDPISKKSYIFGDKVMNQAHEFKIEEPL
jgi:hypothetical protein